MPRSLESIQRKAAKRKAKRIAARQVARFDPTKDRKGSPEYRRRLPKFPDMSKSELRAMLAAALENTAAIHG